jgi:hypothetical protein
LDYVGDQCVSGRSISLERRNFFGNRKYQLSQRRVYSLCFAHIAYPPRPTFFADHRQNPDLVAPVAEKNSNRRATTQKIGNSPL